MNLTLFLCIVLIYRNFMIEDFSGKKKKRKEYQYSFSILFFLTEYNLSFLILKPYLGSNFHVYFYVDTDN